MLVGKILRNRYKIIKQQGSGGFGDTYLATDMDLPGNPQCVVKHLKPKTPDPAVLPVARRLFETEAQVLYNLGNHDQIPQLFAHFEENGEFYLVQEFIDGDDLSKELTPGNCLREAEVIKLLRDILEILVFVHQHKVIHRDIKPENLMRRRKDKKIVLIDFGAVKEIRSLAVNTQGQVLATIVIGTPGYMPTEQNKGFPNVYSDIYAVGILGIQALTGVVPHQLQKDPSTQEIIWRNQTRVSNRLGNIVDKMVAYNVQHRYQSASKALEDIMTSKSSLRSVLIGLGGVAIGVFATVVGLTRFQSPQQQPIINPTPPIPSYTISPPPEYPPNTPPALPESNLSNRVGLYVGESLNKTGYQKGKTVIEITEINTSSRKVRARAAWSEGLRGEGSLFGTVNQDGIIELSGTLSYIEKNTNNTFLWEIEMRCDFTDQNTIKGTYRILPRPGDPTGTQDGEFIVIRVKPN